MPSDVRRILWAQAVRAVAYGFGSVLLGASLQARGWTSVRVGLLLAAIVAGTALASVAVGTFADRWGRRRSYAAMFCGLALAGAVYAMTARFWALTVVALTGTLSTEVVESGPFTSLEQAMLPAGLDAGGTTRIFGVYNAIAAVAGSAGALAAGGSALLHRVTGFAPADRRLFVILVPAGLAGAVIAAGLSPRVEAGRRLPVPIGPLGRSRPAIVRLSALFAVDSFGGGFVVQSFLVYWFRLRFHASLQTLGAVFFALGLLQAASFLAATRLARRIGLLNTMVFTHLPSNVLLAAIPFASSLPVAITLLLGRFALSQMDVPARQAFVVGLVEPGERTAAAAYTNTARYVVRPLGPALAGAAQCVTIGLPFFAASVIKSAYDTALWLWFRGARPAAGGPDAS